MRKNDKKASLSIIDSLLIVNLGGMGDILLSVPAIRAVKHARPKTHITMLTHAALSEFTFSLGMTDEIIAWQDNTLQNAKILFSLRQKNFDLAINMRTLARLWGALKMALMFWLINPKIKMGRDTDGLGFFFDIKIEENYRGGIHELDYNLKTAQKLGVKKTDNHVIIPATQNQITQIDILLARYNMSKNNILIGIHPGARAPSQMWPIERFANVAKHLQEKYNAKIIVTGTKKELPLFRLIAEKVPGAIDTISYCLNPNSLSLLIKYMRLYITNDSGPMHVAAACNTPLIAIFGPGDINHYDPRRLSPEAIVLQKTTPCSPCNKTQCAKLTCLETITEKELLEAAEKTLNLKNE